MTLESDVPWGPIVPESTVDVGGVDCFRWVGRDSSRGGNFGDELGPIIAALLSGQRIRDGRATREADPRPRLLSVGSVLQFARDRDVVWGAGINGKVIPPRYPRELDVRAVRGPITRTALLSRGIEVPPVYGDPALLLPHLLPDLSSRRGTGGRVIVPNLNELDRFEGPEVVSPLGDPLEIVGRIASAEFVTGTSLHALIIADAFGVPSRPIAPKAEHPLKYLDHYWGTGRHDVQFAASTAHAFQLGAVGPAVADLAALRQAFPSDLWSARTSHAGTSQTSNLVRGDGGPGSIDVSVVISGPGSSELVQTLESLATQDLPGAEVIVVTDSRDSRPPTGAPPLIAAPVHHIEPAGGEGARQAALRTASGRWVVFYDAGDIVPPDLVRSIGQRPSVRGSDVVIGDRLAFSASATFRPREALSSSPGPSQRSSISVDTLSPAALRRGLCGTAFARELLTRADLPFGCEPDGADAVSMLMALVIAGSVDITSDVTCLHRMPTGVRADREGLMLDDDLGALLRRELGLACVLAVSSLETDAYRSDTYRCEIAPRLVDVLLNPGLLVIADPSLSATVALLVAAMPLPSESDPLELLMFRLLSAGEPTAAAATATLIRDPRSPVAVKLGLWTEILLAVERTGLDVSGIADTAIESVRAVLGTTPASTADMAVGWAGLARSARKVLGGDAVDPIPEAALIGDIDMLRAALGARRRLRGRLSIMRPRWNALHFAVHVQSPADGVSVALFPIGTAGPVSRLSHDALSNCAPRDRSMTLSARSIPLHAPFGLGLWDDDIGACVGVEVDVHELAPRRRDTLLLERVGSTVTLRRRRNPAMRALGRIARRLRARLRR